MNSLVEEFNFEDRILETSYREEDAETEVSLRPESISEYIGQ